MSDIIGTIQEREKRERDRERKERDCRCVCAREICDSVAIVVTEMAGMLQFTGFTF